MLTHNVLGRIAIAALVVAFTGSSPAGAICGDGIVELDEGETCDDGNTEEGPGDNCPAGCVLRTCTGAGTMRQAHVDFASPGGCAGDCNQDGRVTVDELVRGVNIALGTIAVDRCPSMDSNVDHAVTVDELVRAVNNALNGCSAGAEIAGLTVFLRYPENVVRIPGSGNNELVQGRIVDLPETAFSTANDQDYALTMVIFTPDSSALPAGRVFTVIFDDCQGAPTPTANDFTCAVTDAARPSRETVAGATCSVALP